MNSPPQQENEEVLLAVHGVVMRVTAGKGIAASAVFPALHALPRGLDATNAWAITVSETIPGAAPSEPETVSTMRIPPDAEVRCWRDECGVFCASLEGGTVRIDPKPKQAVLQVDPGSRDQDLVGGLATVEILRYEGLFPVHAGAVEVAGSAVLVCGGPGQGKSTLTAAWACLGNARFMAQDRCVVFRRDGLTWIGGIADELALLPDTVGLLQDLGIRLPTPLGRARGKLSYNCHDFFLSLRDDPAPVRTILFLVPGTAERSLIRPCEAAEKFALLQEASFYTGAPDVMKAHFEALADLANNVPAYAIASRPDCIAVIRELDCLLAKQPAPVCHPLPPSSQHAVRIPPDRAARAEEALRAIIADPEAVEIPARNDMQSWREILRSADRNGLLPVLARSLERTGVLAQLHNPVANVLRLALRNTQIGVKPQVTG